MVALDSNYQSRAKFHLMGTAAGVPAGDRARIEEAVNDIPDETTLAYIKSIIDQCDRAFNELKEAQNAITVAAETYAGDINRTVLRAQRSQEIMKLRRENWHFWVDQLARSLWVPDYTTPMSDAFRYARWGGEWINSIPGSDGRNGDNYWLALNFA